MAKFDVHRLGEGILVGDCQADLLSDLATRFVVPLVLASESWGNVRRLNPVMSFSGADHALLPKEAMSFDRRELGVPIGSLTKQDLAIGNALDMMISGFRRPQTPRSTKSSCQVATSPG